MRRESILIVSCVLTSICIFAAFFAEGLLMLAVSMLGSALVYFLSGDAGD